MQTIYIKFASETDRARGFLELAKHSGISCLPGQVYQVRREALPVLKKNHINYRKATFAEVSFCRDISKHHLFRAAVARSRGARGHGRKLARHALPKGEL